MRIDEALYAHLVGTAAIVLLIAQRVYPDKMPPGVTLPAITFQQVSSVPVRTMGGRQGRTVRMQVNAWGATRTSARQVAEAIIAALDHYKGTMGGVGGVTVRGAQYSSDVDMYDPESKLHQSAVDFEIWFEG